MNALLTLLAVSGLFAWDSPLLVVENNNVVWAEKCTDGALPEDAGIRATATIGTAGLTFVGNGRVADATLGEAFCVEGECKGTQVALPLTAGGAKNAAGVILPPSVIGKADVHAFELTIVEGNDSYGDGRRVAGLRTALPGCGAPEKSAVPEGSIWDCRTYRVNRGRYGMQVMGIGVMQANQYPLYESVRFRLLEKEKNGQEWKPGPWHEQPRGKGSRLPSPVAVLAGAKSETRVVWLRQIGICCPSDSSAWITDVGAKTIDAGAVFEGGLGQPCD